VKVLGILAALLGLAVALLFLVGGERTGREASGPVLDLGGEEPALAPPSQRKVPVAPDGDAAATGSERTADRAAAEAAAEEERPLRTLTGLVVGEGMTVAGARLRLFAAGIAAEETRSARTGAFELSFPVPREDLALRVEAEGYAPLELDLGSQRVVGVQRLGNLFLARGTSLGGTVLDEAGRPVADAEVHLTSLRGFTPLGTGETTRTGSDGRFTFPLAPSGVVVLSARAPGYADLRVEHRHGHGREALLELVPGTEVVVRVLDVRGRPAAGLSVVLRPDPPGLPPREMKTDEAGRASFAGLASRTWRVVVSGPGFKPSGGTTVDGNGGEVVVRVVPWPCVEGRVLAPGGRPAPPATRLQAVPSASRGDLLGRLVGGTPVGAEGSYRVCDLRPGEYRLVALAPGYAVTSSQPFRVGDVEDVALNDLVLLEAGTIVLRVESGRRPVAGVTGELFASPPLPAQVWSEPAASERLATSDSDGELSFTGLSAGRQWIVLRSDTYIAKVVGPLPVASGQTTAPSPIGLLPGARIHGRVTRENGAGVAGARVHVAGDAATVPFLETGEGGLFVTPALPAGTYVVEATSVVSGELHEAGPIEVRLGAAEDGQAVLVLMEESS
jgi:hypothetical protein